MLSLPLSVLLDKRLIDSMIEIVEYVLLLLSLLLPDGDDENDGKVLVR